MWVTLILSLVNPDSGQCLRSVASPLGQRNFLSQTRLDHTLLAFKLLGRLVDGYAFAVFEAELVAPMMASFEPSFDLILCSPSREKASAQLCKVLTGQRGTKTGPSALPSLLPFLGSWLGFNRAGLEDGHVGQR
jgi:hypothetical protein